MGNNLMNEVIRTIYVCTIKEKMRIHFDGKYCILYDVEDDYIIKMQVDRGNNNLLEWHFVQPLIMEPTERILGYWLGEWFK